MPNPWDAGSARLLASLGFVALATTSAGLAYALGRPDGEGAITRAETLGNARSIVAATTLPVSADLENCFADDPKVAATTITAASEAGLVGGSIEDATGRSESPIYDFTLAVERVAACVEASRRLPFPFTLTARAEGFLHGQGNLEEVIRRLQAFEKVGADVLFAPGLPSLDAIRAVCSAVSRPVNVVVGIGGAAWTVDELSAVGVRRISVGSALSRLAFGSVLYAARDIFESGRFDSLAPGIPYRTLNQLMADSQASSS